MTATTDSVAWVPDCDGATRDDVCLVIPTVGRPSLRVLLDSLAASTGPVPRRVVVVDDRRGEPAAPALDVHDVPGWLAGRVVLLRTHRRSATSEGGPAAARNTGWRDPTTRGCTWIAFLDDDVVVTSTWLADLDADLPVTGASVGGSQGRIEVPLPVDRRPTDWERGTAGLAGSRWITADMAYRRDVLEVVGGFEERFLRAFREDADLALRVLDAGHELVAGTRLSTHPVRPARWRASLDQQRGNADDELMRRLHGRGWGTRADAPSGRRARHVAITGAGAVTLAAAVGRRPAVTAAGALAWTAGTAEFAVARIAPGPRTRAEVARMVATSVLIPPAATGHWLAGLWRHRRVRPWREQSPAVRAVALPAAVLFDRDGTLVRDVPYNGDPGLVEPVPGASAALARLRRAGIPVGVVSNQSGVARGMLGRDQVDAVNARVEQLLGPIDTWQVCLHDEADGCRCRKPAAGLVVAAAGALGVAVDRCAVIGDIGADVGAALAAGARPVLVPTSITRPAEVAAAPAVCPDLATALDHLLGAELRP